MQQRKRQDYARLLTPEQLRRLSRRSREAAAKALQRWEEARPPAWDAAAFGAWINTPPPSLSPAALERWNARRAEVLAEWEAGKLDG